MKTFKQFVEDTDMNVAPKGTKPPKKQDSDKDDTDLVKGNESGEDEIEDGSEDETSPKKDSKGKGTAANMIRNESIDEGFKEVPTHLKSGKPNPNHPAFKTHEAKYKADKEAAKQQTVRTKAPTAAKAAPNLDKIYYDLTGIIGQFYPDGDPADYFPKYYRQNGINYDIARKAFKKHGYKDEYDYIDKMKDDMGMDESAELTDLEKEQKAIYDAQTIQFKKDAKANSELKAKPMKESVSFKAYLEEMSAGKKTCAESEDEDEEKEPHEDTEEDKKLIKKMVKSDALKEEHLEELSKHVLGAYAKKANHERAFEPDDRKADNRGTGVMKALDKIAGKKSGPLKGKAVTARFSASNGGTTANKDRAAFDKAVDKHAKNESVFDWKKNKSEIDWKSDDKKSDDSTKHTGTYGSEKHVAPSDRKADGSAEKKSVGRPKGNYGEYNIDRAKREDPKAKEELSKKVMAAKADGFKDRAEFKAHLHREIAKKQLSSAGLDPKQYAAEIEKQVAKGVGKVKA